MSFNSSETKESKISCGRWYLRVFFFFFFFFYNLLIQKIFCLFLNEFNYILFENWRQLYSQPVVDSYIYKARGCPLKTTIAFWNLLHTLLSTEDRDGNYPLIHCFLLKIEMAFCNIYDTLLHTEYSNRILQIHQIYCCLLKIAIKCCNVSNTLLSTKDSNGMLHLSNRMLSTEDSTDMLQFIKYIFSQLRVTMGCNL